MAVREKLVELFYDNNVKCDQKIEGLADDVMEIIFNRGMGTKITEQARSALLEMGRKAHGGNGNG